MVFWLFLNKENSFVNASLICRLTKKVMKEPVISFDGITYEKSAIIDFLKTNKYSPVTNEPMPEDFNEDDLMIDEIKLTQIQNI